MSDNGAVGVGVGEVSGAGVRSASVGAVSGEGVWSLGTSPCTHAASDNNVTASALMRVVLLIIGYT